MSYFMIVAVGFFGCPDSAVSDADGADEKF